MPSRSRAILLDDRLLIEELLVGLRKGRATVHTTTYWFYRACRAAVLGAGGHLSGPFDQLDRGQQDAAIASLLNLREDIALPEPRLVVPAMVEIAGRHPRLNLLNIEAVAAAQGLRATVWLSPESANGVLPAALNSEHVSWQTVTIE